MIYTLQWRHNERDGVSIQQHHDCLLNRLFKAQIKGNIKAPRHWPLWGEFTGHRGIPRTKCFHLMTSSWNKIGYLCPLAISMQGPKIGFIWESQYLSKIEKYLTRVVTSILWVWYPGFYYDDVIKWKHFPRYWPFVRGIHWSPVNSPHKARDAKLWCFLWSASE